MKRGISDRKATSKPILVWFPKTLVEGMNKAVVEKELSRSKFIRDAVREKLNTLPSKR